MRSETFRITFRRFDAFFAASALERLVEQRTNRLGRVHSRNSSQKFRPFRPWESGSNVASSFSASCHSIEHQHRNFLIRRLSARNDRSKDQVSIGHFLARSASAYPDFRKHTFQRIFCFSGASAIFGSAPAMQERGENSLITIFNQHFQFLFNFDIVQIKSLNYNL